jgi:hypothetical protein
VARIVWLLFLGILVILITTKQYFWVATGIIVFVMYVLTISVKETGSKIRKAGSKARSGLEKEIGEMEKVSPKKKKLSGIFEEAGKGILEKVKEYQSPKGAKSYKEIEEGYAWKTKGLSDAPGKFLKALKKFFEIK